MTENEETREPRRGGRLGYRGLRALVLAGRAAAFTLLLAGAGCARFALEDPGFDVVPPPEPLPNAHPTIGLVSAVAATDRLRADWRVHSGGDPATELALFVGLNRAQLFDTAPIPLTTTQRHAQVLGLQSDDDYWIGLAQRAGAGDPWTPSGPVLSVRTSPIYYVDPAASGTGDGTTPATAFNDIVLAVLTAFVNGGGNVYVLQGEFTNVSIPLFTRVHLYGGFSPTFRLSERDALGHPTRLVGFAGAPIVDTQNGTGGGSILDGFELDGQAVASEGVNESSEAVEVRSVSIQNCGRGVKLRAQLVTEAVSAVLVNVASRANALEGLSVDGAFDLEIDGCLFDSNANEGVDLNHLVAPEFGSASLRVRGSRFDRNGTEGLDCHLGAPLGAGPGGGSFEVRIQDCDFEANALDGLRVDVDYESFPAWDAAIEVRGSRARANRASGIHLDLDARSSALVHRVVCSANSGGGLDLTSETFPGHCVVSASAFLANAGHGARASLGHYGLSLAHCVFAGNLAGGVRSELVGSFSHSCVFDRQPDARFGCAFLGDVETPLGTLSPFVRAADEYVRVDAAVLGTLTVAAPSTDVAGASLELLDDQTARTGVLLAPTSVAVDPAPDALVVPTLLALFHPFGAVEEDWRLASGSPAGQAGLAAPGGPAVDCGPFGGPEGGLPGVEELVPARFFTLATTVPPWTDGVPANDAIELHFRGGTPASGSIAGSVFAFDLHGTERAIVPALVGGAIAVPAPAGGWADGDVLVVFASLASDEGARLASTIAIPIQVP